MVVMFRLIEVLPAEGLTGIGDTLLGREDSQLTYGCTTSTVFWRDSPCRFTTCMLDMASSGRECGVTGVVLIFQGVLIRIRSDLDGNR